MTGETDSGPTSASTHCHLDVSFRKDLYLGGDTHDWRELSDKARPAHQATGEEKAPINHCVGRAGRESFEAC